MIRENKRERVVITGMGTVNSLGNSIPEFWEKCLLGTSGIRNISDLFNIPSHMSQVAGVSKIPFSGTNEEPQQRNRLLAELAVAEAIEMAQLAGASLNKERCGVFLATAIAEISLMEKSFVMNRGSIGQIGFISKEYPYFDQSFFFNHISKSIAEQQGYKGGSVTITTGCTGGNDAMGYALHRIRSGKIDIAITGAVEAPITPLVVAAFSKIGATSKKWNNSPQAASRPFDIDRDGFVLAEGCGILILESLSHAKKRGAQIFAEVCGVGSINNCYHMTDIPQNGDSIARACTLAMEDAGVSERDIDFINVHGSSTPQNDTAESNAFKGIFKNRFQDIPVTSIKSQLGHALSAANSLEVISAALTIRDQVIPPTINLENQDPGCPLMVVSKKAMQKPVHTILKTSSGFSGIHSSLVIRKI